jgi:hypothetical protein
MTEGESIGTKLMQVSHKKFLPAYHGSRTLELRQTRWRRIPVEHVARRSTKRTWAFSGVRERLQKIWAFRLLEAKIPKTIEILPCALRI